MSAPAGDRTLFVWEDAPPQEWPAGYDHACVKVCDGRDPGHGGGFAWGANAARWTEKFGAVRVPVWAVAYPADGDALAHTVMGHTPAAPYVVLDVEDWPGVTWSDTAIEAIVAGFRRRMPHAALGYSSYPTRGQCLEHHINQALWDHLTDFAVPQVYYDYQRAELAQVLADHKHPHPAVAPADDDHWQTTARTALDHTGGVFYWRMGVTGWQHWPALTPAPAVPVASGEHAVDQMRPTARSNFPPGPFVAWTGAGWYVTDMLHRTALPADTAVALHGRGLPVVLWPEVTSVTIPA